VIQPRNRSALAAEENQPSSLLTDDLNEPIPPKKGPVVNLPDEPSSEDTNSLEIIFRMPVSGERVKRRYLKSDTVQLLYDFIDHL
jgi:hypothetical protein